MRKRAFSLSVVATPFVVLSASSVQAQSSRTWVAGTGSDASASCSRAAPCQTFAGALAKTALSGQINCLESRASTTA